MIFWYPWMEEYRTKNPRQHPQDVYHPYGVWRYLPPKYTTMTRSGSENCRSLSWTCSESHLCKLKNNYKKPPLLYSVKKA